MQRFTAQCSSETHCMRKQFLYKDTNPYLKWRAHGHASPKLLPPSRVLSSPCYLRSGKRTASQEQLQRASSRSAAPFCTARAMSLLTSSGAESLGQHIIYLPEVQGLLSFENFILKRSLLQITYMSSDSPGMKPMRWICSEQVTPLSLVFLGGLQGERVIWNLRTAYVETWAAEKAEQASVNFMRRVTYMTFLGF